MRYVALLRGINVGGKSKVDMKQLRIVFEQAGMTNGSSYINTGNVLFETDLQSLQLLTTKLEQAIQQTFGFFVKVLVKTRDEILAVAQALPDAWVNDTAMKCDVMFLWRSIDTTGIMSKVVIKPGIDNVKYVSGTLLWSVDRKDITKSGMLKLIGTDLYAHMTVRNCNTLRKLAVLLT